MPEADSNMVVVSSDTAIVASATARQRDRAMNESAIWEAKSIELSQQIMVMKEILTDEQREQLFPEPPSVMDEAEIETETDEEEDKDGTE